MPTLHLLGTGAAVSDAHRTTTMLAVSDAKASRPSTLVIDCGGDVMQRLMVAGLMPSSIAGLIVTHAHPDHVSGLPLFIEKIWLAGRTKPLPICGIRPALAQAQRCLDAFTPITSGWDTPPLDWHTYTPDHDDALWDDDTWRVTAAPVIHAVPNIGLRIESKRTGTVVAYSCDTEPCDRVAELADKAHILVHEATGEGPGHSSAEQAAQIAHEARAERLLLVHLPPGDKSDDMKAARNVFERTSLGEEGGAYTF